MSQEIKDQLMDMFFQGGDADWKRGDPDYDLDNIGGLEVELEPEDVKDINQVEAFTISEEVMGTIYTTYRKRKIVEL